MTTSNKKLYSKFVGKVSPLRKDKNVDAMYESLFNGKNSYLRMSRKGSSFFDSSWIEVIEDCLYDLGEIVNNPREVTVTDSNITPIELAKKVDGTSVQHLASHTQFIKEIDEKGDVVPSKILSHSNIDDIHTYENRFIATFIRRLMLFVNKRYEFIKSTVNLTQDDVLYIKNKTIVDDQEVEIESKITIKKKIHDQAAIDAEDYIKRILLMREYIQYYYSSPFMKQMKNEKDVRKPILQTNIIRKNPKYRKCFETFTFIERFDTLGVSYHIDENYQVFNEEERGKINYLLLNSYLAVQDDEEFESIKKTNKVYKPKILTSIDDEEFTYGEILKGPIEFVRIDEKYRQYLDSKIKKDLPAHPNKYEKEFFKEEYDYKKERKLDNRELDLLIARKHKEAEKFEKLIEKLIAERNFEEAEAKRKELEAIRAYENHLLEIKRQRIIEEALKDKEKIESSPAGKKRQKHDVPLEAAPIEENKPLEEAPVQEEPLPANVEEPVEEQPVVEEATQNEETPIVEEAPQQEEPAVVEEAPQEEPEEVIVTQGKEAEPIEEAEPKSEKPQFVVVENEPEEDNNLPGIESDYQIVDDNEEVLNDLPQSESMYRIVSGDEDVEEIPLDNQSEPVVYQIIDDDEVVEDVPPQEEQKEPLYRIVEDSDGSVKEEPEIEEAPQQEPEEIAEVPEEEPEESQQEPEPVEEVPLVEETEPITEAEPINQIVEEEEKVEEAPKEEKYVSLDDSSDLFAIKTDKGYFVDTDSYSNNTDDALIFLDRNDALSIAKEIGGEVIKL